MATAPGHGTLRQEDVSLAVSLEGARARLLPLDGRVLALLAPDSRRALEEILASRAAEIDAAARRHQLAERNVWLATYSATAADATVPMREVVIRGGGREFRALEVIALTAGFGEPRLRAREPQSGLYLFPDGLDAMRPLRASIGSAEGAGWDDVLRRLEREAALVRARSGASPGNP